MIRFILVCALTLGATCAPATDLSIHAMLVNDRVLELSENTRLTRQADGEVVNAAISPNGKHIAYFVNASGKTHLCLVKSGGGKSTGVMSSGSVAERSPGAIETWMFPDYSGSHTVIAWSPDSRMFAVPAKQMTVREGEFSDQNFLLVLEANGAFLTSLPITGEGHSGCSMVFNPDSRKIAVTLETYDEHQILPFVAVLDVQDGSSRVAYSQTGGSIRVEGWTSTESLLCSTAQGRSGQLRIVHLTGEPDTVVAEEDDYSPRSSDGLLKTASLTAGIVIEDIKTGRRTQVLSNNASCFECWVPNSRRFAYTQTEMLRDDNKQRSKALRTLWLANPDSTKFNTMCVALDHQAESRPTWSDDGMKMAYLCDGRLYVAELGWRNPTVGEKLAAGLRLAEEEEKDCLSKNGKQIGVALRMYATDWDGQFPREDTLAEDMKAYGNISNTFLRPGTREPIFNYFFSGMHEQDIDSPESTVVGELDAGWAWKVLIYADGHVTAEDK